MKASTSIIVFLLSCSARAAAGFQLPKAAAKSAANNSALSMSISPSSIVSLLVRGGAAAEPALQNFYGDALGYFGGIRIPASFLAGSSLAAMFIFKTKANNGKDDMTALERRVLGFYHISSLLAFLLSLNTIATATIAHTAVLHGRFNKMAETAYIMMRREFEYEL